MSATEPSRTSRGPRLRLSRPTWGDLGSWLLAFGTAFGLWFFVNSGERATDRTLRIRIDPQNVPDGMIITNGPVEAVDVQVSGSAIIVASLDPKRLRPTLDLSGVRPGVATFSLGPEMLQLPRKVEVVRITPSQVSFHIDRKGRKTVPIRLQENGEMAPGLRVTNVRFKPDKVDVSGPLGQLEALKSVDTESVDASQLQQGVNDLELRLVRPGELLRPTRSSVQVKIDVEWKMTRRELPPVPVRIRGEASDWTVRPDRVRVVLRGVESVVRDAAIPGGVALVDLPPATGNGNAPRRARVEVEAPAGTEIVSIEPEEVSVVPVNPSPPPLPKPGRAERRGAEGDRP